ncbi:MAG: hypothetical protein A4S17_13545 [Proteobacteria bacterium HN_bin10]|nr:MAG: hypothetical protein A4S17_13545 [Proteobacteria bacterium HN_bin10]
MTAGSTTIEKPAGQPGAALRRAAGAWFFVMVSAQWIFVFYIIGFYGVRTFSGNLASWNGHPFIKGHVPGDLAGNVAFGAHVLLAALITMGGTLQLVPQVRSHMPWFHRWNGRLFLSLAILVSVAGFYMVWLRAPPDDPLSELSISLNGLLILVFATLAWRAAATRNVASHRRWALRALLAVNGVFFLRLIFSSWLLLTQTEPSAALFVAFDYLAFLLPLVILQLYLHASDRGGGLSNYAVATVLYAASAIMALGAVGFSLIFVRMIVFGQN